MNGTQKISLAHHEQLENEEQALKYTDFARMNKVSKLKNITEKLNQKQNQRSLLKYMILAIITIFIIVFGILKITGYQFQAYQLETSDLLQVEKSLKSYNTVQIKQEIQLNLDTKHEIDFVQKSQKSNDNLSQNDKKSLLVNQNQQHAKSFRKTILASSQVQGQKVQKVRVIPKQEMERIMEKFRMNNLRLNTMPNKSKRRPMVQSNQAGISQDQVDSASFYITLKDTLESNEVSKKQRAYYEEKYNISSYKTELPICVVVPSYNNMQNNRYKANMNSILQQNYKNFHVVFIDDASTDQTFEKTLELINQRKFPLNRVNMIKNDKQMFAMHNLRRAAFEFCKPEQIYVIVDGDDQLIGRQVFSLYNALFQSTDSYFIYTNFMTPRGSIGYSRPIHELVKSNRDYRNFPFVISHLRAFYTKLFQLVKQSDLRDQNAIYFHAANDVAICMPILEMSGDKVEYFPQITYLYNSDTGLNNHMIRLNQQKVNDNKIRRKQKYSLVQNLFEK